MDEKVARVMTDRKLFDIWESPESVSSHRWCAQLVNYIGHGIGEAQAKRMLLPELNNPNYCYFEFHEDYSKVFGEGSGAPFLMPHNHARRAKVRSKRDSAVL